MKIWIDTNSPHAVVMRPLIAEGRLHRLQSADQVEPVRRESGAAVASRVRRDPALLAELLLTARESKLG